MQFKTAWSTNAVSVCHACGMRSIERIEVSRRFLIRTAGKLSDATAALFDRMTEMEVPMKDNP
jgi:phosphoribosylformylglycinamidine synthase